MAFSNALLGIVHSMAHKIGAVFHIPHGCANAIFLPYVIQYNRSVCEDRYANIARVLKLEGQTNSELTDSLIEKINEFNKELNIPATALDLIQEKSMMKQWKDYFHVHSMEIK